MSAIVAREQNESSSHNRLLRTPLDWPHFNGTQRGVPDVRPVDLFIKMTLHPITFTALLFTNLFYLGPYKAFSTDSELINQMACERAELCNIWPKGNTCKPFWPLGESGRARARPPGRARCGTFSRSTAARARVQLCPPSFVLPSLRCESFLLWRS